MPNDFGSLISVAAAIAAVLFTGWQVRVSRRALQAQSYLLLEQLEIDTGYRDGMQELSCLAKYTSYDSYISSVGEETQKKIYNAISHLNFVAHLVDEKYMPLISAFNIYYQAFVTSKQKVPEWWFNKMRENNSGLFKTYDGMALLAMSLSEKKFSQLRKERDERWKRRHI